MKKFLIYFSIIVLLFVGLYAIDALSQREQNLALADDAERLYNTSPDKLRDSTKAQLQDENYQSIILPDELKQRLDNEESLFVYFFSPECPFCVSTTPQLMPLAEQIGVTVYQFNVLEFNQGWAEYQLQSTPTLIYFENGKEADRLVGGIVEGGANTIGTYQQFLNRAE